jgi:hypothetical protein
VEARVDGQRFRTSGDWIRSGVMNRAGVQILAHMSGSDIRHPSAGRVISAVDVRPHAKSWVEPRSAVASLAARDPGSGLRGAEGHRAPRPRNGAGAGLSPADRHTALYCGCLVPRPHRASDVRPQWGGSHGGRYAEQVCSTPVTTPVTGGTKASAIASAPRFMRFLVPTHVTDSALIQPRRVARSRSWE